jgi:uncharacterized surface protein with fasciclin (FAS1) repeats
MKLTPIVAAVMLTLAAGQSNLSFAQESSTKPVMVGGAQMYPGKTIVENAQNSKEHTTLVAALNQSGLVKTLQGEGPFTVFAPIDAAFRRMPDGALERLLKPENSKELTRVLTYHVVPGKLNSKDLLKAIKEGKGKAVLTTVNGAKLTVTQSGEKLMVADAQGVQAMVTIADVNQSNGVIYVVDKVLIP